MALPRRIVAAMVAARRAMRPPTTYSCYYLVIHYPSAEAAAHAWINDPAMPQGVRLLRGGETIPLCRADVDAPFDEPQWPDGQGERIDATIPEPDAERQATGDADTDGSGRRVRQPYDAEPCQHVKQTTCRNCGAYEHAGIWRMPGGGMEPV